MGSPSPPRMPAPTRTPAPDRRTLHQRLAVLEENQRVLERTLCGLARESGVVLTGLCPRCGKARMLGAKGMVHCPHCGNRHSL